MGIKNKIETYIPVSGLPRFLHDLADAIERGGTDDFTCVEDFEKIKISIKKEFGQVAIKTHFKPRKPCAPISKVDENGLPLEGTKPPYEDLKKRMKSSFKMIVKMVHDEQLPPKAAVDSFLADSELMVSYPGYGDEYYDEYMQACEAFRKAFASGDVAHCRETVIAISKQKGQCHARYD